MNKNDMELSYIRNRVFNHYSEINHEALNNIAQRIADAEGNLEAITALLQLIFTDGFNAGFDYYDAMNLVEPEDLETVGREWNLW